MTQLFKKAAVFTDIHFGLKSNSKIHNDDCERFVDWYIEQAKANGCDVGIFTGDWHHNRSALNLTTMDASLRSLEKLGKAFDKFYFFPGNFVPDNIAYINMIPRYCICIKKRR